MKIYFADISWWSNQGIFVDKLSTCLNGGHLDMNKWEAFPILHDQLWLMILFKSTLALDHQKWIWYFYAYKPVILSFVLKIERFNSPVSKSIAHNPGSMGPRNTFIYILSLSRFYFYFLSIWICFETGWVSIFRRWLQNWEIRAEGNINLTFSPGFLFWHFTKPGKSTQNRN